MSTLISRECLLPSWAVVGEPTPVRGLPPPLGAHELAWSHILDRVFADAYRARIATLRLSLPFATLVEAARLRSELTPLPAEAHGSGLALLAGGQLHERVERVYTLAGGGLAPSAVRSGLRVGGLSGWVCLWRVEIFDWRARVLGLPIRLADWSGRSDRVDRLMCRMRERFVSDVPSPAYYRLAAWRPA